MAWYKKIGRAAGQFAEGAVEQFNKPETGRMYLDAKRRTEDRRREVKNQRSELIMKINALGGDPQGRNLQDLDVGALQGILGEATASRDWNKTTGAALAKGDVTRDQVGEVKQGDHVGLGEVQGEGVIASKAKTEQISDEDTKIQFYRSEVNIDISDADGSINQGKLTEAINALKAKNEREITDKELNTKYRQTRIEPTLKEQGAAREVEYMTTTYLPKRGSDLNVVFDEVPEHLRSDYEESVGIYRHNPDTANRKIVTKAWNAILSHEYKNNNTIADLLGVRTKAEEERKNWAEPENESQVGPPTAFSKNMLSGGGEDQRVSTATSTDSVAIQTPGVRSLSDMTTDQLLNLFESLPDNDPQLEEISNELERR